MIARRTRLASRSSKSGFDPYRIRSFHVTTASSGAQGLAVRANLRVRLETLLMLVEPWHAVPGHPFVGRPHQLERRVNATFGT